MCGIPDNHPPRIAVTPGTRYKLLVKLAPLVVIVLAAARPALAEDERALSAGVGWASFSTIGKSINRQAPPALSSDAGGVATVSYEQSVSTDISLRGELAGGAFYGGTQAMQMQSNTSFALLGDAGAVFRFDVLKFVPYAFAGIGGVISDGGPIDRGTDLVLVIGGGLDWLRSRERSYGLEARVASFGGDITVMTFGLRGTVRWGFL
jgi:hypothetical protein